MSTSQTTQEVIIVDLQIKNGDAIVKEDKAIEALTDSIVDLRKANKLLRDERDKLGTSTETNKKKIEDRNAAIDKNNKIIKDNSSKVEQQRMNIGNYTDSINKSVPALGAMTDAMMALTNPVAAVGLAVGALTALIGKNAEVQKAWNRVTDSTNAILQQLSDDLVSVAKSGAEAGSESSGMGKFAKSLIFSNPIVLQLTASIKLLDFATGGYITKLTEVGEKAADAAQKLRELQVETTRAQGFSKVFESAAETARRVRDDQEKSFQDRLKATKTIEDNLLASRRVRVNVLEQEIQAIKDQNPNWKNVLDITHQIEEKRREMRDIEEEINGKLTENIMARRAIHGEIKKQAEVEKKIKEDASAKELDDKIKQDEILIQLELDRLARISAAQAADNERRKAENDAWIQNAENNAKREAAIEEKKSDALIGFSEMVTKEKTIQRNLLNTLFKQDALKETAINTYDAAVAAYKSLAGIPIVGPILGAAAAAAVGVFGAAQITKILGISFFANGGKVLGFAGGGLSGTKIMDNHGLPINRSNGDNRLATVKTGEVILNERQQRALGGDKTFRDIGVPGYATGGRTGLQTSQTRVSSGNDLGIVVDAIKQMKIFVTVEDINARQAAVNEINQQATVI